MTTAASEGYISSLLYYAVGSFPAAVNHENMALTLGEKLRQAREERGISISEVAEQTRISPLYLQSIENDDYKPLPGGIFNKGFVKSYAKFIGIDEQEALQDYSRLLVDNDIKPTDELKVYRPEVLTDDRTSGSMLPTIIFAGIILALMTGGILFVVNYIQNQPDQPAANIAANNANANRPANAELPKQEAVPAFDQITVEFKALSEKVSVTASIDGAQRTEEVVAGATSTFNAKDNLKLSYYRGFAEMVELKLNGKAMKPPAPPARGNAIVVEINKLNAAAIWQSGDLGFVPVQAVDANTNTAAAPQPTAQAATPTPAQTTTPQPTVAATPARTATPVRTPTPAPTRPTVVVGSSPAPSPRTTP